MLFCNTQHYTYMHIMQGPYRIFEKKFPEFSLRGQPNFPEFWTLIFLFFSKFNNILAQVTCMLHVATRTILAAYKIPWVFPELRQKVSKFPEFSRFSLSLPNLTNFSRFSRFSLSRRDPVMYLTLAQINTIKLSNIHLKVLYIYIYLTLQQTNAIKCSNILAYYSEVWES